MSDALGPMTFGNAESIHPFLGQRLSESREFSEETARRIDQQVQTMLADRQEAAHQLLTEHQEQLSAVAEALLDHEVVSRTEVEQLMAKHATA